MRKCGKYEDLLARFIHGDLLFQEKEDLESHLAVCMACERLYRDMTDADRALREIPEKLFDPPPYLRARILAGLPEPKAAGPFAWAGRGWAVALGGVLACALLAFALFRAQPPTEERTASAPPPRERQAAVVPPGGKETPAAEEPAPAPGSRGAAGTSSAPAVEPAVPAGSAPGKQVAAAPKVEVIREVRIYFFYPPAKHVAVTGDFNGWDPKGVPLTPAGKPGLWETNLRLPPGAYSYNFIVDGNVLVPDPNAPNQMPDGYGGTNSIMLVRGDSA